MTTHATFAAVDWGTSGFRLWLVDGSGRVLATRKSRQGMTLAAEEGFARILSEHLAATGAPAGLPVIICGMAGARQGWVEAGYADVPTALDGLAGLAVKVGGLDRDVRILPGLAQRNPERPDVMRGEETQLIGAMSAIGSGRHRVCMPGTHSKWVSVDDGVVTGFSTFMTGEIFAALSTGTILKHAIAGASDFDPAGPAFGAALSASLADPGHATSLLFSVRARGLLFGADASASLATLSGTMIGLELAGALAGNVSADPVILVSEGRLAALYRAAFDHVGQPVRLVDADEAVLSGLARAAGSLWS